MAAVKVIPARTMQQKILLVAAYCRVSSNSEDQWHSYAAQVLYYTKEICFLCESSHLYLVQIVHLYDVGCKSLRLEL